MDDLAEKFAAALPAHKASLTLRHNEHLGVYQTVAQEIDGNPDYYGEEEWVSAEQRAKAIETNEIWTLHWYPNTPVGFNVLHAADLSALLKAVTD